MFEVFGDFDFKGFFEYGECDGVFSNRGDEDWD